MSSVNGLLAALLLCAGAEGSTLAFSASDGRSATLVMAGQDVFSFASGALVLHLPLEFLDAAPTTAAAARPRTRTAEAAAAAVDAGTLRRPAAPRRRRSCTAALEEGAGAS